MPFGSDRRIGDSERRRVARIGAWVTRIDGRVTRIDDAAAAARCRRRLSERLSGRRGRADDLSESLRWAGSGGHSDPSNHPSHSDPSDHPSHSDPSDHPSRSDPSDQEASLQCLGACREPLPYKGSRRPCTGNNKLSTIRARFYNEILRARFYNNNTGETFEAASTHVRGDPPGQRAPGEL